MKNKLQFWPVLVLGTLLFCIQIISSVNVHWSDSELWSIALGHQVFNSHVDQSFFYKPIFTSLNWAMSQMASNNSAAVTTIRIFYALIGMLGIALSIFLTSAFTKNKENWKASIILTLALWLSFSLYLSQGFRVRSDLLASVLSLAALSILVKFGSRNVFAPALLQGIALLVTPKAVLFLIINLVFISIYQDKKLNSGRLKLIALYLLVPIGLVVPTILYDPYAYSGALKFFVSTFSESWIRPAPFSLAAYSHVLLQIQENWHLAAVFGCAVFGFFVSKDKQLSLTTASTTALVLILLFPDRLPFFLLAMMWLPVIWTVIYFLEFWESAKKYIARQKLKIPVTVLSRLFLFVLVVLGLAFFGYQKEFNNNKKQIVWVDRIEELTVAYSNLNFYDATGALPKSTIYDIFPAPEQDENEKKVIALLKSQDLDLVFFGQRLYYYYSQALEAIESNYFVSIGGGAFAKSIVYDSLTKKFLGGSVLELCKDDPEKKLFVWLGNHFLRMNYIQKNITCGDLKNPKHMQSQVFNFAGKSEDEFIALTSIPPFEASVENTFAQVFSDDSQFKAGIFHRFKRKN